METRFPLFAPTGLWKSAKTLYFTALLEGFGDNKFSPTAKMAKPLGTFAIFSFTTATRSFSDLQKRPKRSRHSQFFACLRSLRRSPRRQPRSSPPRSPPRPPRRPPRGSATRKNSQNARGIRKKDACGRRCNVSATYENRQNARDSRTFWLVKGHPEALTEAHTEAHPKLKARTEAHTEFP